jgi:hypothetical protein
MGISFSIIPFFYKSRNDTFYKNQKPLGQEIKPLGKDHFVYHGIKYKIEYRGLDPIFVPDTQTDRQIRSSHEKRYVEV